MHLTSPRESFGPRLMRGVLRSVLVIALAGSIAWLVMSTLPGDAATIISKTGDPATVAQLREELGLNQPTLLRWFAWFTALLAGDGGTLFASGMPTWTAVAGPAKHSIALAILTLPSIIIIGWITGAAAGMRAGSLRDAALSGGAQVTLSIPDFALTTALIALLASGLRLVPAVSLIRPGSSVFSQPTALVIPVIAIVLPGAAWLQRMIRGLVADATAQPHVRAARLAGHHPLRVFFRYVAPTIRGPLAQATAGVVPYVLAGTVVVENVTGYPGAGVFLAGLIAARETTAVASITLVLAAFTTTAFLIADLIGPKKRSRT